ncbi:MAG: hypothetical protein ER33_15875 [Cyanobium sp. CACIAM 14]|nr:MAG: hypothetical protein ER33_15875 [Cyanobium sp. CACIAM 14]
MPIHSRTALLGTLLAIAALASPVEAHAAAVAPAASTIELRLQRIAAAIRERRAADPRPPAPEVGQRLAYGFGNGGRGGFANGARGGFANGSGYRGGFANAHPYYGGGGGFVNGGGGGGGFVNARYGGGFVNGGPYGGGAFRNW